MDGAGNRIEQTVNTSEAVGGTETFFDYNEGNELECSMKAKEACSKSSSSELSGYASDGAGNEIAINGYAEPENTSFSYNNLNQLKDLTPPSLSEEALAYLGSGQSNLTGLGSTTVQNSALGITSQTNESGASYYARTPAGMMVDERLPGSTSYNPVYDAQGDVIGLLNESGELKQTVRYGPYGENTTVAGSLSYSATNDPFLFQGGYHMSGGNTGKGNVPNGLYHFGERYYEPTTGRWTQPDPVSDAPEFAFAGDDPVNESDRSGRDLACAFELNCEVLHKIVSWVKGTGLYHAIDEETVSWSEFVHRLQTAFHIGKEVFGIGHCIYELANQKGACPNP